MGLIFPIAFALFMLCIFLIMAKETGLFIMLKEDRLKKKSRRDKKNNKS